MNKKKKKSYIGEKKLKNFHEKNLRTRSLKIILFKLIRKIYQKSFNITQELF